jgi:transcriptional regulator with XRE-family HTH domain
MVCDFDKVEIKDDTERIFGLRKRLKMSLFQFAKELGISTSYLGQVERGDTSSSKS